MTDNTIYTFRVFNLTHTGSMVFGGSLSALASIGASATAGKNVPKK